MKNKANKVKVWIARDENGKLFAFSDIPNKTTNYWGTENFYLELDRTKFPSVKWEDDEPTEAYIILAEPENKSKLSNRTFKKRLTSFLSNFIKLRSTKH